MTMTLDPPGRRSAAASDATAGSESNAANTAAAAERLQREFAAVRVSFTWFGVRKTLTTEQRAEAAEHFGADGPFLSAAKKLLDTKDPAYRAVTSVRGQILAYWRGLTLPYPDPGVRLIRQDAVGAFDGRMAELRDELDGAVDGARPTLRAAQALGPASGWGACTPRATTRRACAGCSRRRGTSRPSSRRTTCCG